MTEKILRDGVDVAGCNDYREVEYKEMPICMNYYNHLPKPPKETEWQYCAGNKNCYYKQLKRAEIEIEKLKGVDGSVHPDSAYYKITRLEQENKELKEICTKICYQSHGYTCRIWELKESKYKSTLEEIKHILEIHKDELEECLHNDIDGMIENKINEVLQQKVDLGFWDKEGNYKEDIQKVDSKEL